MKKLKLITFSLLIVLALSSCATVFVAGKATCQRTKPALGQPQREVRVGWLIADILLFTPALIVDFATCKIYKPCQ